MEQNNNVNNKSFKGLIFINIILVILVIGLIGFIVYDKVVLDKNDSAAELIKESRKLASGELKSYQSKNSTIINQHLELFDIDEGPLTVEKYISAKKPSLEAFEEIIKNVRIAQGYTEEEAKKDTQRVVELHQMLAEQNPNSPNTFFQSSTK